MNWWTINIDDNTEHINYLFPPCPFPATCGSFIIRGARVQDCIERMHDGEVDDICICITSPCWRRRLPRCLRPCVCVCHIIVNGEQSVPSASAGNWYLVVHTHARARTCESVVQRSAQSGNSSSNWTRTIFSSWLCVESRLFASAHTRLPSTVEVLLFNFFSLLHLNSNEALDCF